LTEADYAVVAEALVKRFGEFAAVDRISFPVRRGEIFGFLGPNGSGKSTTIRILCGLLKPTSGRVVVAGHDVSEHAELVRQSIGYMSQKFSLYNDLTVRENLRFYGGMYGVSGAQLREAIAVTLEMAGLTDMESTPVATLSGGWKQHLALGSAMLHRPPIVFLDEPTSGVDPVARRQFWQVIQRMGAAGTTIFVTTHYMDEAEYCNRVVLINHGKLVALGTPAELKREKLGGELMELVCEPSWSAIEALKALPAVVDAFVFGNAIHLLVTDSTIARAEIQRLLQNAGVAMVRFEPIRPSMEDVFVQLTVRRNAAHAEGAAP
jgi:ABC-2 type transport system ATP-binding protein